MLTKNTGIYRLRYRPTLFFVAGVDWLISGAVEFGVVVDGVGVVGVAIVVGVIVWLPSVMVLFVSSGGCCWCWSCYPEKK